MGRAARSRRQPRCEVAARRRCWASPPVIVTAAMTIPVTIPTAVSRTRSRATERDRRVVRLALTDAGRTVADEEMPRRLADDEQLIAALTPTERETLAGLLRKVCAALGE